MSTRSTITLSNWNATTSVIPTGSVTSTDGPRTISVVSVIPMLSANTLDWSSAVASVMPIGSVNSRISTVTRSAVSVIPIGSTKTFASSCAVVSVMPIGSTGSTVYAVEADWGSGPTSRDLASVVGGGS